MKSFRFSGSRIIAVLKKAEGGNPVPELCREHTATFYKWRSKFGNIDAFLTGLSSKSLKIRTRGSRRCMPTRDGATKSREWRQHPIGLPGVFHQPDLLPLLDKVVNRECRHRQSPDLPDPQPAHLGIRAVLSVPA